MKNGAVKAMALGVVLMCLSVSAQANTVTSGYLTTGTGGLTTADGWLGSGANNGFEISWSVTPGGSAGGFQIYDYVYNISGKDPENNDDALTTSLDHFILQVSPNFHTPDIADVKVNGTSSAAWTLGVWDGSNAGTGWPGSQQINGIEFGLSGLYTAEIAFSTTHAPVTGSFFAADAVGSPVAYAYNTGLASVTGETIGVPDGQVLVPEPSLSILALLGLAGGAFGRRAGKKKKEN